MADFDWNKLTIPQLKEQLKKRGLDQSGKKADLIGRLVANNQGLFGLFQPFQKFIESLEFFKMFTCKFIK